MKEGGGRRKEEGGKREEGGGRRKEQGGRREEEGGRRKEEGGRRKEEGGGGKREEDEEDYVSIYRRHSRTKCSKQEKYIHFARRFGRSGPRCMLITPKTKNMGHGDTDTDNDTQGDKGF